MSKENNLINRIRLIFTHLKSQEIIEFLNQWNIDKVKLLSLVIESKLGYDLLINDPDCNDFINDIEESSIYSTAEYSQLVMFISTMGDVNSRFSNDTAALNKFQVFHKMLFKTGSLVLKLMVDEQISATYNLEGVSNPLITQPQSIQQPQPVAPAALKVVAMNYTHIRPDANESAPVVNENSPVPPSYTVEQKIQPNSNHFSESLYQNLPLQKKDIRQQEKFKSENIHAEEEIAADNNVDDALNIEDNITLNSFLKTLSLYNIPTEA